MSSPPPKSGREDTAPFLVKLFYRTGSFVRPEEFGSQNLPPHVPIYTWPDCTLKELGLELAAARSSALPTPAVGTRLAFQLVYPDLRNTSATNNSPPRFAFKELGTIVLGEGGPGAESSEDTNTGDHGADKSGHKTLSDARFVVGDYISCAILPPLSDGSVAPTSSIHTDPNVVKPGGRGFYRGGYQGRENGSNRGSVRGGRVGWRENVGDRFPMGDWRRGEALPNVPAPSSRGRGRW